MKRPSVLGRTLAAAVIGLSIAGVATSNASAKTLKAAVGLATSSAQYYAFEKFADYVEANSDLKVKVFSMSLLNLKETPPGVRDGIADMGFVLPPYYPAEYAENNLASNLSMLSTTGRQVESPGAAMAGATSEYTYFHCPECLAEYKKENQVYLGTGSSPTYIMLCSTPVRTLEELKGKKYRSGAANFGRWAEHFGGVKVSIPGNDIYEALGQGVIDCAMLSATELTNLSLFDLVKFVTPSHSRRCVLRRCNQQRQCRHMERPDHRRARGVLEGCSRHQRRLDLEVLLRRQEKPGRLPRQRC